MSDEQEPAPDDSSDDGPREGSGENRKEVPGTGGADSGGFGDGETAAEELQAGRWDRGGDGHGTDEDRADDPEGDGSVGDTANGAGEDGGAGSDTGPVGGADGSGPSFGAGGEVGPVPAGEGAADAGEGARDDLPDDVRKYARFKKMDGAQYERVNEFLRDRTYITAREWAIARLCADFRTETGVEMTKIGENLPELVPFMEDTYSPQAVNQARSSFEEKVHKAGATFLYGAMCDFFTAEELDDLMYEVTEVAKFLLEVEGVDLSVDDELAAEDRISGVMREVREASEALRYEECPNCGHDLRE